MGAASSWLANTIADSLEASQSPLVAVHYLSVALAGAAVGVHVGGLANVSKISALVGSVLV